MHIPTVLEVCLKYNFTQCSTFSDKQLQEQDESQHKVNIEIMANLLI